MPEALRSANADLRVLGADVAKLTVALHDSVSGRGWNIDNTPEALAEALRPYTDYDWLICETTGGYERRLLEAAAEVGLRACRADAAQVKAFIASHGGRAKTDRIDAAWLSRYGLDRAQTLKPWRAPTPAQEAFGELLRHRQALLAQRVQASNRLSAPGGGALADLLNQQIAFLTGQITDIDAKMAKIIKTCPDLARDENVLRAIPGIGPVAARTLLALLPELGKLGPKQVASLAGLAPHPHESGQTLRRKRMIGGRPGLRPVLFMAALSAARAHPTLAPAYKRLVSTGKPKRVALAAIARRLVVIANAVIRDDRTSRLILT